MHKRIKVRTSVVVLIALAVFGATSAESIKGCGASGGSSHSSHHATRRPHTNGDKVQQWCRNAQINDPDTWVYHFFNPVTGEEGYIRGRGDAEVWRRLHTAGRITLHCK